MPEDLRVSADKESATIEGELDAASELVLRIGEVKDKLIWTTRFANGGAFKAVVELSNKLKLEDGSFGSGFTFSTNVGTGNQWPIFIFREPDQCFLASFHFGRTARSFGRMA